LLIEDKHVTAEHKDSTPIVSKFVTGDYPESAVFQSHSLSLISGFRRDVSETFVFQVITQRSVLIKQSWYFWTA
jgi:hypothetical protein